MREPLGLVKEATNKFIQELLSKGLKVQALEPVDNEKSKITFVPRIKIKEVNNG